MIDQRQNRIQAFAFVLSACAAFCLAYHFARLTYKNSGLYANPAKMSNQINPNKAEVESLIRLPDIGFSRADAIIYYRDIITKNDNYKRAYETSEDLQNIKGIGPKTVQNMSRWLKFE